MDYCQSGMYEGVCVACKTNRDWDGCEESWEGEHKPDHTALQAMLRILTLFCVQLLLKAVE